MTMVMHAKNSISSTRGRSNWGREDPSWDFLSPATVAFAMGGSVRPAPSWCPCLHSGWPEGPLWPQEGGLQAAGAAGAV